MKRKHWFFFSGDDELDLWAVGRRLRKGCSDQHVGHVSPMSWQQGGAWHSQGPVSPLWRNWHGEIRLHIHAIFEFCVTVPCVNDLCWQICTEILGVDLPRAWPHHSSDFFLLTHYLESIILEWLTTRPVSVVPVLSRRDAVILNRLQICHTRLHMHIFLVIMTKQSVQPDILH